MSIVAVHGPNTFGSQAVVEVGAVMATVNPANGLIWDFKLDSNTTRPDQDFSWAFPPNGTPTPQALADPTAVTYATGGAKTATLTVTNLPRTVSNKALTNNVATLTTTATHGFKVGQSVVVTGVGAPFDGTYFITGTPTGTTFTYDKVNANVTSAASGGTVTSDPAQYPPAGSYPIIVTAVAGVAPRMAGPEQQGTLPPPEGVPETQAFGAAVEEEVEPYDPAEHTVAQVLEYADANPDQVQALYDDEVDGKNRTTLIDGLLERGATEA